MYAVSVFQLAPPLTFHGQAVVARECLPDDHVAVALEAPDVHWREGGGLWSHEVRLRLDGAPQQISRLG